MSATAIDPTGTLPTGPTDAPLDPIALAASLFEPLPCQLADPDLFFAEEPALVEQAKALCLDCPVRATCLAQARDRREPWGVWGGEWFAAGVAVGRKRPRGRPRKDDPYARSACAEDPTTHEVTA